MPNPEKEGEFLDVDELTAVPHPLQSLVDENFRAVRIAAGDTISAAISSEGDLRVWGSFRVRFDERTNCFGANDSCRATRVFSASPAVSGISFCQRLLFSGRRLHHTLLFPFVLLWSIATTPAEAFHNKTLRMNRAKVEPPCDRLQGSIGIDRLGSRIHYLRVHTLRSVDNIFLVFRFTIRAANVFQKISLPSPEIP